MRLTSVGNNSVESGSEISSCSSIRSIGMPARLASSSGSEGIVFRGDKEVGPQGCSRRETAVSAK